MNLDSCTPGQRESVQQVNGPLLISAGAGSGKTFTLTQRIAYALLPESGPALDSVDEVLAITFTEKAAAEIKARVKRTLRAEGLFDEALRVDAAWISTIHGMCSRILHTHAFELGIDPAFGIMADAQRAEVLAACIDEELGGVKEIIGQGVYGQLFEEFPPRSTRPMAPSVASMLDTLINKAAGLRGGLAALSFGPAPTSASVLARELLAAYEQLIPVLDQAGGSATAQRVRGYAAQAVEVLRAYLDEDTQEKDLPAFALVLEQCEWMGGSFKAEVKEAIKDYQAIHAHVCQETALGLAHPVAEELLALARKVGDLFEEKKRTLCMLDNDDLLVKTLKAFEDHPHIAHRYADRFKLVMVDEFQDTSQLQIDLIAHLAGERCCRLCTVGDAQQSIYRFRGADVKVYEEHKQTMRSPKVDACYVELTKNFRSHADVLSFVDRVFEQPQVFGKNFMSLAPHHARRSIYRADSPRIEVALTTRPAGRGSGVNTKDAKAVSARVIAQRFAAFREAGHAPRDMVVLLGAMSNSGIYAQALRDEGFECAVTGGSLFSSAPEVRVVGRLVETLANPGNTAALFEVLSSDMVRLSADDLLALTTEADAETGRLRRRDLDRGFVRLVQNSDTLPPRLAHAVNLIAHAQEKVRTCSLSEVVQQTVVQSGWMARLDEKGAEGLACAANILKAVRLLERLETEQPLGLACAARAFVEEIATGRKESPGTLSGTAGNVVKIMTIHSSKGLEFPLVALADFDKTQQSLGKLVVGTCGGKAWASLSAGLSLEALPQVNKRHNSSTPETSHSSDYSAAEALIAGGLVAENARGHAVCSQDAYRSVLEDREKDEELAESRRKLYVGLTRASEALVIAMEAQAASPNKSPSYTPLVDDVRRALCGAEDFPQETAFLEYGGSQPARFERIIMEARQADDEEECLKVASGRQPERFVVPLLDKVTTLDHSAYNPLREKVFSYSSISVTREPLAELDVARGSVVQGSSECDSGREQAFGLEDVCEESASFLEGDLFSSASEEGTGSAHEESATGLGSAFHRAAQFAIEAKRPPDTMRLEAIAQALVLSPAQRKRFEGACARWFTSSLYATVLEWPLCRAEVPFYVKVGEAFMEGEIDLLCSHSAKPEGLALVIDYKTGGMDNETTEQIYAKHLLQAQCYAYALLVQGFCEVELCFVRIEHLEGALKEPDGEGLGYAEPQVVKYHFMTAEIDCLREVIIKAKDKAY